MATPRTTEQLEEYLKAFKEKKLKQKQLQRQKHQKQLQELYKKVDKTLKQEKKQKAEEIINSFKQLAPEPPKQVIEQTSITITVYNNPLIEKLDWNDDELYSMDDLLHIEQRYPNEEGRINWKAFEELTNKTRNKIYNIRWQ